MTPIEDRVFNIVLRGLMGSDIGLLKDMSDSEILTRASYVLNMMMYAGAITKWESLSVYLSESDSPRRMLVVSIHDSRMGTGHFRMKIRLEDMTRNNLLVLEIMES